MDKLPEVDCVIRKACENDRIGIAKAIAYSYEKDFSALTKDMDSIAKILEKAVIIDRFYVAEQDGEIIGIIACTDCTERAIKTNKSDCKKYLGFIRGLIGFRIFYSELMCPLTYPVTTGYIEIVGVLPKARGKGVAKKILKAIIEGNSKYSEFVLDVTDINTSAQKIYTDFGFVEFDRIPEKHAKMKGFNSKIYMRYTKQ